MGIGPVIWAFTLFSCTAKNPDNWNLNLALVGTGSGLLRNTVQAPRLIPE